MYPLGHYGLALLLSAPAALYFGKRNGTLFTIFTLLTALTPDIDLLVPQFIHHGVTHTIAFALVVGVGGGLLVTTLIALLSVRSQRNELNVSYVFLFVGGGLFLGTFSHVVGDILVLLPNQEPISPFWPISNEKVTYEIIPLGAVWRNLLLLSAGLVTHAVLHVWTE